MLTLCVQFGVVPDSFTNGLLIPIPRKLGATHPYQKIGDQ